MREEVVVKWGVQHVKVTLESESGETVVVEQDANGRVKCEPGKAGKTERAANSPPKQPPKAASPTPKQDKERTERKPPKAETAPKAKTSTPPRERKGDAPREGKGDARKPRRSSALKWSPVKDHGYEGFAAPSASGRFKVLKAKDSQWALFYELKGTWPKHIGCFGRKVDKAQERAQELHDAGWPETEFGPITAGQVASACPVAPGDEDDGAGEAPAAQPEPPKTEVKSDAAVTEAEADRELMGSFTRDLDAVLDDDDDD